ncbi:hypothetical protein PPERSA_09826 [Pseudocohnilembus persalinus]|uniref:Ion transport domain-containing protein n=1 Tax=Pseudocohnilembus persalinus TaxID=266149 RepID=A0A0V0QTZ4_PSEPJ|nr:hypothetical protein PPERSA_09826 [Pseudocohnilembus persalinus]|eukprot:KRX05686.1 hypothetical protein PPERSA_09826 [Pseudocohnilembus persalinus]
MEHQISHGLKSMRRGDIKRSQLFNQSSVKFIQKIENQESEPENNSFDIQFDQSYHKLSPQKFEVSSRGINDSLVELQAKQKPKKINKSQKIHDNESIAKNDEEKQSKLVKNHDKTIQLQDSNSIADESVRRKQMVDPKLIHQQSSGFLKASLHSKKVNNNDDKKISIKVKTTEETLKYQKPKNQQNDDNNDINNGLSEIWKKAGFRILMNLKIFANNIKTYTSSHRYLQLDFDKFSLINDFASDYDYCRINTPNHVGQPKGFEKKLLAIKQKLIRTREQLKGIFDLIQLIILILFVSHCSGCAFNLIAYVEQNNGIQSWLQNYMNISDQGMDNNTWYQDYILSLYWAVITMVTVGFGNFFLFYIM